MSAISMKFGKIKLRIVFYSLLLQTGDEEDYDEEDDDFLTGDHSSDKSNGASHHHDTDESEDEYDDETELGPTLGTQTHHTLCFLLFSYRIFFLLVLVNSI